MKKLINDPAQVVTDYLRGLSLAHSDLVAISTDPPFVTRADKDSGRAAQVAVVSGGGSGHEPLHCGLVGPGMLHGAVPGPVFTSPPAPQIHAAAKAADEGRGVVMIVKNYTGDVLNFETAAELLDMEDVAVESVLVADDVAVEDSTYTAGRRGVAGTLVVEKVAGAAAARGDDLAVVAEIARKAAGAVRSMGVALESGISPTTGQHTFDLDAGQIEIGIGIHGEPGREHQPHTQAKEIIEGLIDAIARDGGCEDGSDVLLFVNGMGSTTDAELHICYGAAHDALAARGVNVVRSLVGSYVTSLDMAGVSVTVCPMDDELLAAWDAPCATPAFTRVTP
ncbi:dihydroxyacetone kinase subunit DhaK [Bowdeniella nasicola]|uniref:Dihydroxyacetone kinase subunit DhaK n=1 Tax=Bowdeniella nasicola TaxID=208480 RepID=A0A1Q5Q113_9ACTO|nr:dihydroxyacetone kinase subunit DhaK [Bowdeniella nasicola]OKL53409.1 dihydroxyacetone kinase subunit DhaK [Bowdeniella nasicola]